jgi:epoxyqueuosine reductase QueG
MSEINSGAIKELVLSEGVDLVGVAEADGLLLGYPPRPAAALMPTARSVIVMAVAHSLGAVRAPDIRLWTRNKMQTSRLLDRTAEKVGRFLEGEGFMTLPISADKPVEIHKRDPETGRRFPYTRVVGHLSLKHAAVSAGMGQIGRSNLLLTEEFGPHQRLGGIVTEAPLEPDSASVQDLCLPGCKRCQEACPVGALSNGQYEVDPCYNYWTTGMERMRPRRAKEFPPFFAMLYDHWKRRDPFVEIGQIFITDVDFCIACMKACPVGTRWESLLRKPSDERQRS